jgi:hypothetical protein
MTIGTAVHAMIFVFGIFSLLSACCSSDMKWKLRTTGELYERFKSVICLVLMTIPAATFMLHVWHGFTEQTLINIENAEAGVVIDTGVRVFAWMFCYLLLKISRRRMLKDSYLLRAWWLLVFVADLMSFRDAASGFNSDQMWVFTWSRFGVFVSFGGSMLMLWLGTYVGAKFYVDAHEQVRIEKEHTRLAFETAELTRERLAKSSKTRQALAAPNWKESRRGTQLWSECEYVDDLQFTDLRYTSVSTSNPRNFSADGYHLRCFSKGYNVKILICLTIKDEEPTQFRDTVKGICENLKNLTRKEGPDKWSEMALVVMVDGDANESMLSYAASIGIFDQVPASYSKSYVYEHSTATAPL